MDIGNGKAGVRQAVPAASQARADHLRRRHLTMMIGVQAAQTMIGVAHQVVATNGLEAAVVPMITTKKNQKSSTPKVEV